MSLLQIYQCQRKNFDKRLTFGEVMGNSLVFVTNGAELPVQ